MEESILYGSDPGSEGEAEGVPSEAEEDTRLDENQDEQKSAKPPKKEKTVKNPMPKLDEVRLMGPRGMTAIEGYFKEVELKGKGHELQDLDLIMGKLQLWTHRLFPQMKFEDTLEKIEALGHKKPVQAQLHKIRLGLITQSDVEGIVGDDDRDRLTPDDARLINDVPTTSADDIFDNLVASQSLPTQRSSQVIPSSASSPSSPATQMSDELRKKIEENRRKAQERLIAKRSATTTAATPTSAVTTPLTESPLPTSSIAVETGRVSDSVNGDSYPVNGTEVGEGSRSSEEAVVSTGTRTSESRAERRESDSEDFSLNKENESVEARTDSPAVLMIDDGDSDLESRTPKRQKRAAIIDSDSD